VIDPFSSSQFLFKMKAPPTNSISSGGLFIYLTPLIPLSWEERGREIKKRGFASLRRLLRIHTKNLLTTINLYSIILRDVGR